MLFRWLVCGDTKYSQSTLVSRTLLEQNLASHAAGWPWTEYGCCRSDALKGPVPLPAAPSRFDSVYGRHADSSR